MQLTLIRHGPTEWNASRRFQGRSDLPLSEAGRLDAGAIAVALRAESIDRIYSSDLARALQTARIVAESHDTPVVSDRRLREFDFGRWEGMTWEEIVAAEPRLAGQVPTGAKLYAPEAGESFAQVRERVLSFLDDARREYSRASLVVVTHAGPLHAVFSLLGLDSEADHEKTSLNFAPGGITRIAIERDRARLLQLNDLRHLESPR